MRNSVGFRDIQLWSERFSEMRRRWQLGEMEKIPDDSERLREIQKTKKAVPQQTKPKMNIPPFRLEHALNRIPPAAPLKIKPKDSMPNA